MADLNRELNEYLLSSKNEKQYKLNIPSIPKPNIGKWLGRDSEDTREESGWFRSQNECCAMVSTQII